MQTWTLSNGIVVKTEGINGTRSLFENGTLVDSWAKGTASTPLQKLAEGFIRK